MKIKRTIIFTLLLSLALRAQEGELTLDPNDIPLTPDPATDVPVDNSLTLPNLEEPPPDPTLTPAPTEPVPSVSAPVIPTPPPEPQNQVTTPPEATPTPPAMTVQPQRVEEFKPTPSNLEVKAESDTQKREDQFNQTYKKFYKEKTSSDNWQKVVGKRTSDTYVVNKGDTLWDISGTLFGDPFYWPKIWSLNKDLIYNPHVIFPDMKIKFFQGDSKSVPTLATDNQPGATTDEKTDEKKDVAKNNGEKDAETSSATTPEGDEKQADPVPKNETIMSARRSLPSFFKDHEVRIQKQVEIKIEERVGPPVESNIDIEFYISEDSINSVGSVVEVESDLKSVGRDQIIFVKMDSAPEGVFTVIKPGKKVASPTSAQEKIEYNVQMYEVEGEIKILGRVNSSENVYRARVLKSNTLVSEGSLVVPGKIKTFRLSDASGETTANKGRIIGNLNSYEIIGQGNFVLIDQGAQSGYQPSLKLPIFEDLSRRRATSLVRENPMKVGTVLIVDATTNFSIGYVTRVTDRAVVNDLVAMPDTGEFGSDDSAKVDSSFDEGSTPAADESAPVEEF